MSKRLSVILILLIAGLIGTGLIERSGAQTTEVLRITTLSGGRPVAQQGYTVESLEAVGTTEITGRDVHLEKEVTYRGVPVAQLLKAVGTPVPVAKVRLFAKDGYLVELPVSLFQKYPILLATRINGKRSHESDLWEWTPAKINMGPVYLVFPNREHKGVKEIDDSWNWIFSVNQIELVSAGEGLDQLQRVQISDRQAVRGRELFIVNCANCHQVMQQGGTQGMPLDRITTYRTADQIKAYVRDPQKVSPSARMPRISDWNRVLNDDDLNDLIRYLAFVAARPAN